MSHVASKEAFTDQDILDYERQIKQESDMSTTTISELLPLTILEPEYENAVQVLKHKTKVLHSNLQMHNKRVKRDGNCFYRAFGFSLAEQLLKRRDSPHALATMKRLQNSKTFLMSVGYELMAIEDFYDMTFELVTTHNALTALEEAFSDDYASDALVCYFRLLTAAELKHRSDFYSMFLPADLDSFIATQVEPMCIEADNIHIAALADFFQLKVTIITLDASDSLGDKEISHCIAPDDLVQTSDTLDIQLFFKPGHYDIIYS